MCLVALITGLEPTEPEVESTLLAGWGLKWVFHHVKSAYDGVEYQVEDPDWRIKPATLASIR